MVLGAPRSIRRGPVLSTSFAFGGHNAALVLVPRRGDRAADHRRGTAPRRAGASSAPRRPTRSRRPDPTSSRPGRRSPARLWPVPSLGPATAIGADRPGGCWAGLVEIDGRTVAWFEVGLRPRRPRHPAAEADIVARALHLAGELQVPVLGVVDTLVASTRPTSAGWWPGAGWPGPRRALVGLGAAPARRDRLRATAASPPSSGWPTTSCSPPTRTAYVNGPAAVALRHRGDHRPRRPRRRRRPRPRSPGWPRWSPPTGPTPRPPSPTCSPTCPRRGTCRCPSPPPPIPSTARAAPRRPPCPPTPGRPTTCATCSPTSSTTDSVLEVRADHAPNMVTAYARLDGRAVAVIANQPRIRAGTLDIEAWSKAARHVQARRRRRPADRHAGRHPRLRARPDLEWRGMIRHGAKLVHAYCAATVPRVVRDPAQGLRRRLHRHGLPRHRQRPGAGLAHRRDRGDGRARRRRHPQPARASPPPTTRTPPGPRSRPTTRPGSARPTWPPSAGYVDQVIDPADTRAHLVAALRPASPPSAPTSPPAATTTPPADASGPHRLKGRPRAPR